MGLGNWGGASGGLSVEVIDFDDTRLFIQQAASDFILELNQMTLGVLSSFASPNTDVEGVGGNDTQLWAVDDTADRVYELNTTTLVSIANSSTNVNPTGVGGLTLRAYYVARSDTIYEINPSTRALINSAGATTFTDLSGCGGNGDEILMISDRIVDAIQFINKDTLAIISQVDPTFNDIYGIGGGFQRMFAGEDGTVSENIHELNPITGISIAERGLPSGGVRGVGGIKASYQELNIKSLQNGIPSFFGIQYNSEKYYKI